MSSIEFRLSSSGTNHDISKSYIPKDLKTASHVWIRVDRVRKPLEAPYQGPFKVLQKQPKFFIVELPSGKQESVSVDRLKPAHLPEVSTPVPESTELPSSPTPEDSDPSSSPVPEFSAPVNSDRSQSSESDTQCKSENVITRTGRKVTFSKMNDYVYF